MTFVLVLYIYAGMLAKGDSVSMVTVPMQSMEVCQKAGKEAEKLVGGSTKEFRFVCLKNQ